MAESTAAASNSHGGDTDATALGHNRAEEVKSEQLPTLPPPSSSSPTSQSKGGEEQAQVDQVRPVDNSTSSNTIASTSGKAEHPAMTSDKEILLSGSPRESLDTQSPSSPEESPALKHVEPPPYSAIEKPRRNLILLIVTIAGFFGPLSGGIYLPALPVLATEFRVSINAINATVSLFMVVFAIGPLFWAGMSDLNGRRPLYIISFAIFIGANIILAAVPANYGALIVLRIVQAIGSCSVASLGAGTVADVIAPAQRAFAMSIFLLGPQCGPILGPVLGGIFAGQTSWRWIFGFLAIAASVLYFFIVFFLPETLRSRVGNGAMYGGKCFFLWPPKLTSPMAPADQRGPRGPKPTPKTFLQLLMYPPIGIVSLNTAILFASFYCVSVLQPVLLTTRYNWSTTEVGLSYLASGIAMVVGSLLGGRFSDMQRARHEKSLRASSPNDPTVKVQPERRLFDQIYGVILCGVGTILYGWFAQHRIHGAALLFSTFLSGFGMTWVFVTSTSFLTEVAPAQAAGVFALGGLLRNPAAAVAAVVINPLTDRMGYGWCFTGLGLINLILVGSSVVLLKIKSPGWRVKREKKMEAMKKAKEEKERAEKERLEKEAEREKGERRCTCGGVKRDD